MLPKAAGQGSTLASFKWKIPIEPAQYSAEYNNKTTINIQKISASHFWSIN